jgi:hypothetical protein
MKTVCAWGVSLNLALSISRKTRLATNVSTKASSENEIFTMTVV